MSDTAKDLVHKIYDELLSKHQLPLCEALFDSNFVLHLPKASIQNRDQYKAQLEEWFEKYPEIRYDVKDTVAEGDKIAVRWEGVDKSKNFSYKGQTLLLLAKGKVKEAWKFSDAPNLSGYR